MSDAGPGPAEPPFPLQPPAAHSAGEKDVSADERLVRLLYAKLLRRTPDAGEVAGHLTTRPSLGDLIDVFTGSDEFRNLCRRLDLEAPVANVWTPELAPFHLQPGTASVDGDVEVGRDGALFLSEGHNDVRGQFDGSRRPAEDWEQRWRDAYTLRDRQAEALGAAVVWLVVPDRYAVEPERAVPPPGNARRPVQRLIEEAGLALEYPVERLRAVEGGAHLRADTHLRPVGSRELASVVVERSGAPPLPEVGAFATRRELVHTGLGVRFRPAVAEVVERLGGWPARVVATNRDRLKALGASLGTTIDIVNDAAPDDRTCLIFGDSYAYAGPTYEGIAWWLALAFRRVRLCWLAFGWDSGQLAELRPDVIVVEGAERLAIRAPDADTDLVAYAEQTLARGRPFNLGELRSFAR